MKKKKISATLNQGGMLENDESHRFLLGRSFKYLFILFYYYLVGC